MIGPDPASEVRVALAHDWLVGMRGGERVLDRLARRYGPTDLYTLVNDGRSLGPAIDACRVHTSPLQRLPGARGHLRRHYLPLMPWAVERLAVAPCDALISTSSAVMKSIRPPAGVPHLCYCHSPARYVWEQTDDYRVGRGGGLRHLGLRLIGDRFRAWDRRTADRVTRFLANSRHTAQRIERCYGREAEVVHPPVRTTYFTPDPATPRGEWFLVVAALEPYKRTDLVIDAANATGVELRVVGGGSQLEALEALAGPTVRMLGRVDDHELRELYRGARALVFPQLEDFGIIAAEALACGCPVIAFAGGGALDIVDESTGAFFDEPSADALAEALRAFRRAPDHDRACRAKAEQFSEDAFDARVDDALRRMLEDASRA